MASVDLVHVWLHDADDYSDFVQLRARDIEVTPEKQVERRVYAGGRVRAISRPATMRTAAFEAVEVSRVDLAWMDDRLGQNLMYRDPRGFLLFGFYRSLPTTGRLWTETVTFPLTFEAITQTAEV